MAPYVLDYQMSSSVGISSHAGFDNIRSMIGLVVSTRPHGSRLRTF